MTTGLQRPRGDDAKADRTEHGAFYTPRPLADWVAARLLRSLPPGPATIVDFAAGEGALLAAVARRSRRRLRLVGADIDGPALTALAAALPNAETVRLDAIAAAMRGPAALREQLRVERIEGVVLNPPWGIELNLGRAQLQEAGFELASGQYDSADLFVELAIRLLPEGAAAALIVPDSLFYPDRAPLRRFLLEHCSLDLVARLGEGSFPGVYRGAAVVVAHRGPSAAGHMVECLRLSAASRRRVLRGEASLGEVASDSSHRVPQERFATAPGFGFSIDVRENDLRHVAAICDRGSDWTATLTSGRGVELSKHGEVIECPSCELARPRPRLTRPLTCVCGATLSPALIKPRRIVLPLEGTPSGSWRELIAGEDVKRYEARPSRTILTGVAGINYKRAAAPAGRRLLVRKTGIGLKAALYDGPALTTQTVFHYQATPSTPDFMLAYALGVLSSRVMLAVHLKRTGELEWRSHPYVTQAVLASLPIPVPDPGTPAWAQAKAIAAIAESAAAGAHMEEADLEIERHVAGLYGLGIDDVNWVSRVLDEAGNMETIAGLRFDAERFAKLLD